MNFLFIDGGTTNTRVRLVSGSEIRDSVSEAIGSSKKDNSELKAACKKMISDIISRNGMKENDISYIVASGMVTSEFGLYCLPHISLPADAEKLSKNCHRTHLYDICSIPFVFTPGLRHPEKGGNMMRGEEEESIGLCLKYNINEPTAIILPGTHNKVILYENGFITEINNMMSGEMFELLSKQSILRYAFPEDMPKGFDEEALLLGAEECREFGLTDAALRIRCISNGGGKDALWLKSFLSGAVLYCDIQSIKKKSRGRALLLGGTKALKKQMAALIRHYLPDQKLIEVDDSVGENATTYGQMYVSSLI